MREIEGHDCEIRAEIVRVRGSTKRQLGFVAALTSAQNFCGDRDLRETIIVLEEVERGEKKTWWTRSIKACFDEGSFFVDLLFFAQEFYHPRVLFDAL